MKQKYQFLINKRGSIGLKHFNDPRAFIEYSNGMQDVYKNIEEYNSGKKRKVLIVFDDAIADMIDNKKLNPAVAEQFIRGRKLSILIAFITQSYFKMPKDVRLNSTYFFIMKIPNKRELQQIASNHLSNIDLCQIICQILLQNLVLFWSMIQLYHQIILQDFEKIF